jgi:hypothetical protein
MLESPEDYLKCRNTVDEAVNQASETRTILMRIREHQHQAQNPAEKNNRRMMYQKLSDNLAITARVLEDVVRRFQTQKMRFEENGASSAFAGGMDGDVAGGNERTPLTEGGLDSSKLAMHNGFEDELQREKNQTLRQVDDDMRCLQGIYTDLAKAADEQQATFDSLENHMATASADIERGRDEISFSRYGYGDRLKRRLMMGGGGVFAVIVVGWFMSS